MLRVPIDGVKVKHGDTVTFSVYIADIPDGEAVYARLDWHRDDDTYATVVNTQGRISENGRITVTGVVPKDSSFIEIQGRIMPYAWTANYQIKYMHDKLEKGSKATDWTPAPEDVQEQLDEHNIKISTAESSITQLTNSIALKVDTSTFNSYKSTTDSAISSLSSRVNAAELKITDSAIVSTVRTSNAYKNDLNGKVSADSIISTINQSAESITIQANK